MNDDFLQQTLERRIAEHGLTAFREFLLGVARPAIAMLDVFEGVCTKPGSLIRVGVSRFNGGVLLPEDFAWPEHPLGPYRSIAQIRLAELPQGFHSFPTDGLLSVFQAHDEDGESFWGDPDYVRIFWFSDSTDLYPREPPPSVNFGSSRRLRFEPTIDVPPWPWDDSAQADWPIPDVMQDAYSDLRRDLMPSPFYLLGYPTYSTLAYDPTPDPGWVSLMTLGSDDQLEWCWHDGDWLMTFIEAEKLQAADFSVIASDAG